MLHAPQGLHAFFRAYYHYKSADWKENKPYQLEGAHRRGDGEGPDLLCDGPRQGHGRNGGAVHAVRGRDRRLQMAHRCRAWRLRHRISRTGFTGALQGYRVRRGNDPRTLAELRTFAGRTVDVPICFIAGKSDWGSYKTPGELEAMQGPVSTKWRGTHFVDGAGHWVQQEQPEATAKLLLEFFGGRAVTVPRRAHPALAAGASRCTRAWSARAQDLPARPITMIVPFPPGGPNDTLGRIMAERMRASLGQPVIVENVSGANGTIGVGRIAHAAADGYTIGIGTWATHVVNRRDLRAALRHREGFRADRAVGHQRDADRPQDRRCRPTI